MSARPFCLLLILALLSPACQQPVAAQDLIGERATLAEALGALTLAQVEQAEFAPSGRIISHGYTRAALWVRLSVDSPGAAPQRLLLRIYPAQLEDVTLFSALLPGEGQQLPGPTAWLDASPGRNTYYLRIRTSGPMLLQPAILTAEQAQQERVTRGFVLGVAVASFAPLLVWLLVLIARRRQLLHLALFINLSAVLALFLGWLGYLPEILGPTHWASSSTAIHFLGLANIFTAFLCVCLVLDRFGLPRWGRWLFALLGVPYTVLFVLFFVLDRQLVLQCGTALGLLASVCGLPLTLAVFYRQKPGSWLIGGIMFLALALGLRWFLTVYALVPAGDSLANLFYFRLLFSLCFVFATLWLIDRERQNQLQTSLINETMARRLAKSEIQRREAGERFMTMLMHEIKTPLAIIQLAATSLGRQLAPEGSEAKRVRNINRSVDELNALVERCVSVDQVDQAAMPAHKQSLCLTTLVAALVSEVLPGVGAERIRVTAAQAYRVFSDAQYLRLILLNLLSNALKYSPPESQVELELDPAAVDAVPGVTVRVSNAVGVAGFPDAAQLFTRYYRAENARSQAGTGLGLWLAQSLTRQLGSELEFRADQERVVFSFFLELA